MCNYMSGFTKFMQHYRVTTLLVLRLEKSAWPSAASSVDCYCQGAKNHERRYTYVSRSRIITTNMQDD